MSQTEVGETFPGGEAHLSLNQINVGDLFGHGVLHLDAGIHFDKDVLSRSSSGRLNKKFHGARIAVPDRTCERNGIAVQRFTQLI